RSTASTPTRSSKAIMAMMRRRSGFTLWEMTIVLAIMAVVATLTAPALVSFGNDQPPGAADKLVSLLRAARQTAIADNVLVTLRVDPATLKFEIDTSGTSGSASLTSGKLELDVAQSLVTDAPRLQYVFTPTGAAFADSVIVRGGADRPLWV